MASRRTANDPTRRNRIVAASLQVVIEQGVHRTTHRRIAESAQVPLGSVTYYFGSLEEIIRSAFDLLVSRMSERYAGALGAAADTDAACEAVTDLICGDEYASPDELVAIYEMYSYANHDSQVRDLMSGWVDLSRRSLEQHFSPAACSAIDALVEGWPIHRSLSQNGLDRAIVHRTITAIAAAFPRH